MVAAVAAVAGAAVAAVGLAGLAIAVAGRSTGGSVAVAAVAAVAVAVVAAVAVVVVAVVVAEAVAVAVAVAVAGAGWWLGGGGGGGRLRCVGGGGSSGCGIQSSAWATCGGAFCQRTPTNSSAKRPTWTISASTNGSGPRPGRRIRLPLGDGRLVAIQLRGVAAVTIRPTPVEA